jgi:predicted component of type VI protein secretion system
MNGENRIVWSEGMYLRVQHFQQSDRRTERLGRASTRDLCPCPWGVRIIRVNRDLVQVGRLARDSVRGVFSDDHTDSGEREERIWLASVRPARSGAGSLQTTALPLRVPRTCGSGNFSC